MAAWNTVRIFRQIKIKVMKKVIKYINNNIVEFKAILDTAILAGMVFAAAMACKFVLLYFA